MGINAFTAAWLLRHFENGLFSGKASIAEFGPQDFLFSMNYMRHACSTLCRDDDAARALYERLFPGGQEPCAPDAQRHFYAALGLTEYSGIDYYDHRAAFGFDLNYVVNMRHRFDVITNFGTAEHLSNIGSIFATTHNLLKEGGIALFVLPAMGYITHGFYNIHPIFFKAFAHYNNYEMVEYLYVDNAQGRALRQERDPCDPSPFEGFLEVRTDDDFSTDVEQRFFENMDRERRDASPGTTPVKVFDYSHVVLRKRQNGRFTWPSQFVPGS